MLPAMPACVHKAPPNVLWVVLNYRDPDISIMNNNTRNAHPVMMHNIKRNSACEFDKIS